MNGYMDLFLETGNPAFYMMAKQGGAASGTAGGTARGAPGHLDELGSEEAASLR